MAVTAASIKAFAPELAAVADAIVETWIELAPSFISATLYGDKYETAVGLWVSHKLTVTQAGSPGASGPVEEQQVGPVRQKFAGGDKLSRGSDLDQSAYGRTLRTLRLRYVGSERAV